MHLYCFDDFRLGAGVGTDDLVDITALIPAAVPPADRMRTLIAGWSTWRLAAERAIRTEPGRRLAEVTLRAPLPAPRVILAAPVNYRRHQAEMGGANGVYADTVVHGIDTYAGFVKASSSIIGPNLAVRLPFPDRRFDYEGEVGVVIGKTASRVPRERALEHVFGYIPLLDITMRGPEDRSYRKSFDTFTPVGPAVVTADVVNDPADIALELTVNGQLRQRANTHDLIYDIAQLIEFYSATITLEPGDLIATGTPEGVGAIQPGDAIVLTLRDIGRLEMNVGVGAQVPSP